jgi:hypothetical protein
MKTKKRSIQLLKNLIAITLFLINMLNIALAQDIITLKNGDEINAKVTEIELNAIKYKKFDNQAGPTYTVSKADVFMIKYENGTKDIFDYQPVTTEEVSSENGANIQTGAVGKLTSAKGGTVMKDKQKLKPYEVKAIMNTNYAALKRYKGARAFNTLGIIFSVIGGIDIGLGISYAVQGYDATGNFLAGGIEIGIGLIFGSVSNNKTYSSVLIYNSGLKNQPSSSLNLGLTPNGLGLCLHF